ncbi:MAG: winged helix-turn-helix transcriptional regulator [Candidatus Diapherotrites archaeon]|nr:winged helix-turn-helix transcriptional regulator [Candidatus Diapherotrites archaeon]
MDFEGLTLSPPELKAISSPTRQEILKWLNERNHTLTELATRKSMAVSSMKEQLEVLERNGLISAIEEGRKWKYYALTPKGQRIVGTSQKPVHIAFIFSAAALAIIFGAGLLWMGLNPLFQNAQDPGLISNGMESAAQTVNSISQGTGTPAIPPAPQTAGIQKTREIPGEDSPQPTLPFYLNNGAPAADQNEWMDANTPIANG